MKQTEFTILAHPVLGLRRGCGRGRRSLLLDLLLEAIQRWSGDMSRVTLNFDLSKIPFVRF